MYNGDCLDVLKAVESNNLDSLVTDPPAGIAFMGQEWDKDKGGRDAWVKWMTDVMRECLRVLKPGAHGLVWALPRTSHWTATALEDAGFEIRDVVTHLFGTGFPKSLDVSKAIDKAAGAERAVIGCDASKLRPNRVDRGYVDGGKGFNPDNGATITAPATDSARQWQGWGTALKPASEHWILVRKPCSEKTVAANVLKWGTGALNIDGCRISTEGAPITKGGCTKVGGVFGSGNSVVNPDGHSLGRFPANLVLDEEAAAMLDEQSGERAAGTGGASRFFYVAKASSKDRGAENTHPTVKSTKLMEYLIRLVTPSGGTVLDPFAGSGSTGVAAKREEFRFLGIEKDSGYFSVAKKRLSECD